MGFRRALKSKNHSNVIALRFGCMHLDERWIFAQLDASVLTHVDPLVGSSL
ncbi:MAG TPA: hypothetical protein VF042_06120 [Gemmatimonadaceae bacterium]